jgi:hypothetical protein
MDREWQCPVPKNRDEFVFEASKTGVASFCTETRLAATAVAALGLGVCVYLLDRAWGSTMFLSAFAGWQPARHGAFGPLGGILPSFLHAYAFTVLLIVALWPWREARPWVALGWFSVAAALEILQAPTVSLAIFGPPEAMTGMPLIRSVALYAARGEFDWADLWATALGCTAAWLIVSTLDRRPS